MFKLNDADLLTHRDPRFIQQVSSLLSKTVQPYHRAEVRGLERLEQIPSRCSAIYIGNHNGYPYMTEAWLFTMALFQRFGMSRYPYIAMHDLPLRVPGLNSLFTRYGCVRASGGTLRQALDENQSLLIYPGGSEELMRPTRDRTRLKFQERTGYVRLALEYNLPIVPVAAVGGHSTALILDDLAGVAEALGAKERWRIAAWPLMLSIPWGVTLGPFIPPYIPWPSKILVECQEPLVFSRTGSKAAKDTQYVAECAARVERELERALVLLEAERRQAPGLLAEAKAAALRSWEWLLDQVEQWWRGEQRAAPVTRAERGASPEGISEVAQGLGWDPAELMELPEDIRELFPHMPAAVARRGGAGRSTRMRSILKQSRSGRSVVDLCKEHGISTSTFYRWRAAQGTKTRAAARHPKAA